MVILSSLIGGLFEVSVLVGWCWSNVFFVVGGCVIVFHVSQFWIWPGGEVLKDV